jgi:hypothetical protein
MNKQRKEGQLNMSIRMSYRRNRSPHCFLICPLLHVADVAISFKSDIYSIYLINAT